MHYYWENFYKTKTFWELIGCCHNFYIFTTQSLVTLILLFGWKMMQRILNVSLFCLNDCQILSNS